MNESLALVHYTKSPEVVGAILTNGFMLVPNRRDLASQLFKNPALFKLREPQQFGMVSFTELARDQASHHRTSFGDFGIVVSRSWASQHGAQRVIYVQDSGSTFESLSWLFLRAAQDLETRLPEKLLEAHLANKVIGGMYNQSYFHLMTLYEFMQHDRDSSQFEWRIVNKLPQYHAVTSSRETLLKELRDLASKGVGTLQVHPGDVEALLCPRERTAELRKFIPRQFTGVPIFPTSGSTLIPALTYLCRLALRLLTKWSERPKTHSPAPSGSQPSIVRRPSGAWVIPPAKNIDGLLLYPDEVLERAECDIGYKTAQGDTIELRIPLVESIRLLFYLQQMAAEPRHRELIELAAKRVAESSQREWNNTKHAAGKP